MSPLKRAASENLAQASSIAMSREAALRGNVSLACRKGCANCCSHPLAISILEATSLHQHLLRRNAWTRRLRMGLEEHARRVCGLTFEIWLMADIPCPLLGSEKECIAHGARPMICRSCRSSTGPDTCHPHRLTSGRGVLDRSHEMGQYLEGETGRLRRLGLGRTTAPLSVALLVAADVDAGKAGIGSAEWEMLTRTAAYSGSTNG